MPLVVVVGRGFAEGKVEVRNRITGERVDIEFDQTAAEISNHLAAQVR